ncbi:MAG TPA: PEP-CTERM sorting domain-containing protein [Vicinamibacterales bacterium]|nr:PEP-CTERM sorting domain-containing protein [Vicinamibacterales bacterium]
MKRGLLLSFALVLATAGTARADIIDFTGGIARLSNGTDVTTNNSNLWTDVVDFYTEEGMKYDFIGGYGTVGDYYSIGAGGSVGNDVVHAHWFGLSQMVITRVDGSPFDLNYVDITSNTTMGGSQQTGTEETYITTNNGYSMLLPSSDWGFAFDFYGEVGDDVARLVLDSHFDGVTSVTITSQNAYCFGMDNFYIDEPAPVPEPSSLLLLGLGLVGVAGRNWRNRRA